MSETCEMSALRQEGVAVPSEPSQVCPDSEVRHEFQVRPGNEWVRCVSIHDTLNDALRCAQTLNPRHGQRVLVDGVPAWSRSAFGHGTPPHSDPAVILERVQRFLDELPMNREQSVLREQFRWARGCTRNDGIAYDPDQVDPDQTTGERRRAG